MGGNAGVLPHYKKAWTLNSDSFNQLLANFHADRGSAGTAYEQLRQRLIHFFDWRGCAFPEELTDETFDRVARRLAEGVTVISLPKYCFGVAQKLAWEALAQQSIPLLAGTAGQPTHPLAGWQPVVMLQQTLEESQFREFQFACLDACLAQLTPVNRALVTQYYHAQAGPHIKQRRVLAKRLGVSLNLLRVRAHRIRTELANCLCQHLPLLNHAPKQARRRCECH